MRPSATARRYAEASFAVARDSNAVDRWLRDLEAAGRTAARPDVDHMFKDPNVPTEEKLKVVPQLFAGSGPHVLNLLRMLALRERMHLLPSIYQEFVALDRTARGVLEAQITVARPFNEQQRTDIASRLSGLTGKQVEVMVDVDPAIIGGIVVRIGDRLIDASVASRLQRLRHELAV